MKSLNKVQTLAKVLQVISKIVFILSIVGIACSVIGLIVFIAVGDLEVVNKLFIEINKNENIDKKIVISYILMALLECVASLIIYKKEYDFYSLELSLNTPFEEKVVKEIRKLALVRIITSIALSICIAIALGVCGNKGEYETSVNAGIVVGVVYLLLSLVLEYGTDLQKKVQANEENNA